MSQPSNKWIPAFFLGWLVGRRGRRSGFSVILLLTGALSCFMAVPIVLFGPPLSWTRSREVASLAQPEPAELDALAPGTRVLVVAQVPPDAPAGPYGLALHYVEYRQQNTTAEDAEQATGTTASTWQKQQLPPQRVDLLMNDWPLKVQFSPKTSFLNAQQFEEDDLESSGDGRLERRYVGYLPGQTLTIEGTWEGDGLVTARTSYAGTPADYTAYMARQPWQMLLAGVICGGLGISLLVVGFALRLVGG